MKITVLSENTTKRDDMKPEHGLSLYIATENHRILFDMGQGDAFYENAKRLGADLKKVDTAFVSHGHYDHGGGLGMFLKINSEAKVYISEKAFQDYYANDSFIGLDKALKNSERLVFVKESFHIDDTLTVLTISDAKKIKYSISQKGLDVHTDNEILPDDFSHEIYLEIKENGQKIIFTGCAHRCVRNLVYLYSPDVVVGGFHLFQIPTDTIDGENKLKTFGEDLKNLGNAKYYTCHCTGKAQYYMLKDILHDRIDYVSCGETFII